MRYFIILLLILSPALHALDVSEKYFQKMNPSSESISDLTQFKILVIPGVLAESFISNSNNALKFNLVFDDGFSDQIKFLKIQNLNYEFIALETENSPEINAKVIIEKIENSDKPVLIYSHSKGGLDTLEAIRQKPIILSKIKGWATIQSPFWGSPIASGFNNNFILRDSATRLFEIMGGNQKGMSSLTSEDRNTYMNSDEIKNLILQINSKINFLNYGSIKENVFGYDSSLELFRNYSNLIAGPNDGVVPISSAIMSKHNFDIDYIIEENVDHLMTMTKFHLLKFEYNRELHTKTILEMIAK